MPMGKGGLYPLYIPDVSIQAPASAANAASTPKAAGRVMETKDAICVYNEKTKRWDCRSK